MSGPTVSIKINGDARGLQTATEQAKTTLGGLAASIKALPTFGALTAGLGALATGGAIKQLIGDTIAWAAGMDDLAEKTGASVENLSGLYRVAKISGIEMGQVEIGLIKLSRALSGADDEAKGAGHALAYLGLNAAELRKMDSAEALEAVANAMARYGDGTGKTALAMAIFGREGAQLLPLLKDLADEHLRAGELTTAQAAAAETLEKGFARARYEGEIWTKHIAVEAIPTLASLLDFVNATAVGIYQIGSSLAVVANDVMVFAKVAAAALGGGFTAEGQAHIKELLAGRARFVEAANEDMVRRLSSVQSLRDKIDAALAGESGNRPKVQYTLRDPAGAGGKGGAKGQTDLDRALKLQRERIDAYHSAMHDSGEGLPSVATVAAQEATRRAADEQTRLNALLAATPTGQLEKARAEMQLLADALTAGVISEEQFTEAATANMGRLGDAVKETDDFARDLGLTFSSAFEDAVVGGKKLSDVLQGLLQDIQRIILRKTITEPLGNAASDIIKGSGVGGFFKGLFPGAHAGGIAGSEATFLRAVSPAVFMGAPRLHAGGIAGDEVPTILRRGEGVFTPGQMKALGGGGGGGGSVKVEIINQGTPQRVASSQASFDARGAVVQLVLADLRDNGPIRQSMAGTFGLRG